MNYGLPLQPTQAGYEYRQTGVFVAAYPNPPGRYRVWVGVGKRSRTGQWELRPSRRTMVGYMRILPARRL